MSKCGRWLIVCRFPVSLSPATAHLHARVRFDGQVSHVCCWCCGRKWPASVPFTQRERSMAVSDCVQSFKWCRIIIFGLNCCGLISFLIARSVFNELEANILLIRLQHLLSSNCPKFVHPPSSILNYLPTYYLPQLKKMLILKLSCCIWC